MSKRIRAGFALSFIMPGVAIAIAMTRVLGDASRPAAAAVYGLGWVAFIFALRRHQRSLALVGQGKDVAVTFGRRYGRPIVAALAMAAGAAVLFTLVPVKEKQFIDVDEPALRAGIAEDHAALLRYRKGLAQLVDAALPGLSSQSATLSVADKESHVRFWASYVDFAIALDDLVDKHKYFYQINPITHPEHNANSFLIGYGAILTQVSQAARLREAVGNNRSLESLFDEGRPDLGIPEGAYHRIRTNITSARTSLRVHAGRMHLKVLQKLGHFAAPQRAELAQAAAHEYERYWQALGRQPDMIVDNPLDRLEQNAFVAWFPLQRGIARGMGNMRTTHRDNFISVAQLRSLRERLEPGDILVERRNWYMTNVGLPGFWPHAALYTGTLEELDAFFADSERIATEGLLPSEYLAKYQPDLVSDYGKPDAEGAKKRVIEAIADGVVLTSLEHSGQADYLGVFRTRWDKEQRLAALMRAFGFHGRPYDYNFDFVTDDAVVCSELVYKAYHVDDEELALPFELVSTGGRLVLPPNEMVHAFDASLDGTAPSFSFVAFLDGSEEKQLATEKGLAVFRESWKRPKWDFAQQ